MSDLGRNLGIGSIKKYVYKRSEGSLLWHNVIYIV